MKIKRITRIEPEEAMCIEVDHPERLFAAGGTDGKSIVSHNSVIQRNIIFGCILRPDNWAFLGVDLKKVELSAYRAYQNVVLGIATTVEDALTVLQFASTTMMKRYAEMETLGVNNFLDLPEKGKALLVMVDEAGELLSPSGVKALIGTTFVPNLNGRKNIAEIKIGDTVFDNYGNETLVTDKYIPELQDRFEMSISSDSRDYTQSVVAGAEHNWVAYYLAPDGSITGPEIATTQELADFKNEQNKLPESERTVVKFKRG